ncbi:MAG TPA: type I-C CRISPR-associated protein Cas5c [Acetobacteraceae bacterium]|nr:type I-C CRISPR-associated protein Cas5c [Acetobacteraceae bacterium]
MPEQSSRPFRLVFWGDYACFARAEMKVERVTYPIMTPSAARGAVEAILWKPQIAWQIERIDRLKPPKFEQVRRNEVEVKASADRDAIVVDQVRQQRAALVLRDVAYVVHARLSLTAKAGRGDTLAKYVAMFERRARAGQCFQRPCLGSREFAAEFRLVEENEPDPHTDGSDEPLGWIFHDFDWSQHPPRPRFFNARLERGRMTVPPRDGAELYA